jgi:hypothetical protein
MYTYEGLDELVKSDLVMLSEYIGMPKRLNMRMLKGEMIEAILKYVNRKNVVEDKQPPASVRIQRIRKSQELEND